MKTGVLIRRETSYSDQILTFASHSKNIQKVFRPTRSPRQQWPPLRTKNGDLSVVFFQSVRAKNLSAPLYSRTFMITTGWLLLRKINFSHKICRENQNHYFIFSNFFPEIRAVFWVNVEKKCMDPDTSETTIQV